MQATVVFGVANVGLLALDHRLRIGTDFLPIAFHLDVNGIGRADHFVLGLFALLFACFIHMPRGHRGLDGRLGDFFAAGVVGPSRWHHGGGGEAFSGESAAVPYAHRRKSRGSSSGSVIEGGQSHRGGQENSTPTMSRRDLLLCVVLNILLPPR